MATLKLGTQQGMTREQRASQVQGQLLSWWNWRRRLQLLTQSLTTPNPWKCSPTSIQTPPIMWTGDSKTYVVLTDEDRVVETDVTTYTYTVQVDIDFPLEADGDPYHHHRQCTR